MGKGDAGSELAGSELAGGVDAVVTEGGAAVETGAAGGEWAALGAWLAAPPPLLHKVELGDLQECVGFIGRARSSLTALEAELVAEIARREGDAAAEEMLRRGQKRSRAGARKAVRTAAQLEWAPGVAEKLAEGAITPEAAGLILDAAGEVPVDHGVLLAAAEEEPDDLFRRTLKEHVNERTSEQELERRREGQRRRRRASISEQPDGMFHLFAQFDPLTGARVQAALVAKADELFRSEDSRDRPTAPQRFADAVAELVCSSDGNGVPAGAELIVLADYDQVHDAISSARLADGIRLTEAETLAIACDAKILPGIFNKHTGTPLLGRSQRKVSKRLWKRLVARDGGCIGCGAHHQICEVHHLKHWAHGGETTLENTCLLCWRCHHVRVHQNGEEITRHPDGRLTLGPPTDTVVIGTGGPEGLGGVTRDGTPGRPATGCEPPAPDQVASRARPRRSGQRGPGRNHAPMSGHRRGPPEKPESRQTRHVSQPALVPHESSSSPAR
ncbi:MAG: DUF222 domain-containing protein [Acidimicrobiia bacterium]|nr:DUF222 domain-containing protein [Acidimicrobiia bacterium]